MTKKHKVSIVNPFKEHEDNLKEKKEEIEEKIAEEEIKEETKEVELVQAGNMKENLPKVRIKPKETFSCYIGDMYYFFKKGVQQSVPYNIKAILQKANKLDPL